MYKLIESVQDLYILDGIFSKETCLGFDIETTSLTPRHGKIRLIQLSNGKKSFILDLFKLPEEAITTVLNKMKDWNKTGVFVIQNAKFDLGWIYYHYWVMFKNIFDTYLAARVLSKGNFIPKSFNLGSLAENYLGISLDKSMQTSDWEGDLSKKQLEYASKDASVLVQLKNVMTDIAKSDGLLGAFEDEFKAVIAIALLEITGFRLDVDKWFSVLEDYETKAEEIWKEIYPNFLCRGNMLFPNLDSPKQLKDILVEAGVKVKNTSDLELKLASSNSPLIQKLRDYRHYMKLSRGFKSITETYYDWDTGRVYSSYNQIGAASGRIISHNPNLQQLPRSGGLRECFCASEGNSLVIADYSQIELRVLAELSKDSKFIEMFNSGKDLHKMTAALVLGKSEDSITSLERYFAKQLNFGLVYGIGAKSFSVRSGISVDEAQKLIDKYFNTFIDLTVYLRDSGRLSLLLGESRSANGFARKIDLGDTKYSMESARRIGTNMAIQSTAAVVMKRALSLIADFILNTENVYLVNNIHDEVIVEVPSDKSEELSLKIIECMKKAGESVISSVPVEIDFVVSENWTKG